MKQSKYPRLFEPLVINSNLTLRNRIISAPLGSLTDKSITGMGMIIRGTSGNVFGKRSRIAPGPYCFDDMRESQKVREQVAIIKQRGTKAEFELCHVGQYAMVDKGDYALGPVGFIREDGVEVRAMDEQMMSEIADDFARGARDAKEYGFDMVMLHFAHGWLPTQFLSPYFNKRTDEYGGSFENRIKFPTMIVKRVKEAVGADYPLDMRISLDEHIDGGTSTAEIIKFIQHVEPLISMVHVSCGLERELNAMTSMSSTTYFPHKINTELSKQLKQNVNIPVAVVGAIMTPEEAESILENNEADAVAIGRQIIADPFWTTKAWENNADDIVPCLRCMNCYNQYARDRENHYGMKSITCCSVNPRYLHEDSVPVKLDKANRIKNVYIIGGGPAGLKAALTADERGHKVVVIEKESHLGGQLHCAEFDETKLDIKSYKDYLINKVKKTAIEVRLNTDANDCKEEIAQKADSLIIAIGATPIIPQVADVKNRTIDALTAYYNQEIIGDNVAIIGGGSIGIELAKLLGKTRKVKVIEITSRICSNLNEHARMGLMQKVEENPNIEIFVNAECLAINESSIKVRVDKENVDIYADTIIYAVGMKSRIVEANQFYGLCQDTNIIGDADKVGTIAEATHSGYFASKTL